MRRSAAPAPAIDERALRRALGRFATGVILITAPGGDSLVVSAVTSVSLDPPIVAFCAGRSSLTWRRMRSSPRLGINVLDSRVGDVRAVGEHALVTCPVLEASCDGEGRPLVFFGGVFGSFAA
jgi:flavin reductase (DIM6/NTAB) family NADH-FMN oxidoreductase RutF